MTEPKTDSPEKKPIKLVAVGITSLILAAFADNFVVQGMKEAKIKEQEEQAAIQAEQKRQAAIQEEQEKQAAIRRRQTAEENEKKRLANLIAEKEAALKAEAERKELISILNHKQDYSPNNYKGMQVEARKSWNEYTAMRRRVAEEEKERRRRELLGE